ncbi:MAG: TRAP transporter small permease subunit [Gammaproteobacteria bacterium]
MTVVTLAVIAGAAGFRAGRIWASELVVYMHAFLFMLAAAYTLRHDGHVRIDVFYGRFSARGRAWINLAGAVFLLLPTCAVIAAYSLPYIAASWAVLEHSPEGGGLPAVFLLKTVIALFAATMILEGLALAARSLLVILSPR